MTGLIWIVAASSALVALALANVTIAGPSYSGVLTGALASATLSLIALGVTLRNRTRLGMVAALVIAAIDVWIVVDVIARLRS